MAAPRICSIPDCGKPHYARGYCPAHHYRFVQHGDPLAGRTSPGTPLRYLQTIAINYEGDDCLIWPYGRGSDGYGQIRIDNMTRHASRVICEAVNGLPPTPEHEAAHSCGKGHDGCVNPNHLEWKTPKQNQADRKIHGTDFFGEKSPNAKLSAAQIKKIRALIGQHRKTEIAKMFGVTPTHIARIAAYLARPHD